ncbi:MAG: protein jag [Clostridiales bacterium]|nr:protein jag [Clostridiales bacterium]
MDFMEFSAKNVDDAVTEACMQLGVTSSELEYEVVEKGSSGFLGLGSKNAVIKARRKDGKASDETFKSVEKKPAPEKKERKASPRKEERSSAAKEPAASTVAASTGSDDSEKKNLPLIKPDATGSTVNEIAEKFMKELFAAMKLDVKVTVTVDDSEKEIDVDMEGPEMGILIGKRGQTLDSLQYLTSLAINKQLTDYYKVKVDTEGYRARRKETLENLAHNIAYKVKRTHRAVSLEPMNPYERRIIHSALQNDKYVWTKSEGDEPFRHVVVKPSNNQRRSYDRQSSYGGHRSYDRQSSYGSDAE